MAAQPQEKLNTTTPAQESPLAIVKRDAINATEAIVAKYVKEGRLVLPSDYVPENAFKQAWLILQDVKDKDGKPALLSCDKNSIANALLYMAVMGLNPAKKQCYFIVYGKALVCQPSYFGDMLVASRVMPGIEFGYAAIYQDDELEYSIVRGRREVVKHVQKLDNVDDSKIVGAYCMVYGADGKFFRGEVMTIEQIRKSWEMSPTFKYNEREKKKGTHQNFPVDMCLRTVIRKTCKPIVAASSDALLIEAYRNNEILVAEAEAGAEAADLANVEIIDVEPAAALPETAGNAEAPEAPAADPETGEVKGQPSLVEESGSGGPRF